MVQGVYVPPLELMLGMVADLTRRNSAEDSVDVTSNAVNENGIGGFRVSMKLDFHCPLVPAGRISMEVSERTHGGYVEAERSAQLSLIQSLRNTHHVFPADYSYIVIAEKRALYNAMREVLEPSCLDYIQGSKAVQEAHDALQDICERISVWIGRNHESADRDDIVAVSEFHAKIREQAVQVDADSRNVRRMADMVALRNQYPEGMSAFERNVPMPMETSWDGSYQILRITFNEAVKKVNGVFSNIVAVRIGGEFKASCDVSAPPQFFVGGGADTEKGALAKLYYAVIKHVEDDLGFAIFDFHFAVKRYMEAYIERFDRNMRGMGRCVEMLQVLIGETELIVHECVGDLGQGLETNDSTVSVLQAVDECLRQVGIRKRRVEEIRERVQGRQTDRRTLEGIVYPHA